MYILCIYYIYILYMYILFRALCNAYNQPTN